MKGQRPARPTHDLSETRGLTDNIWEIITQCWAHDPKSRPTVTEVVVRLRRESQIEDDRPADDFDATLASRLSHAQANHSFTYLGHY